MATLQDGSNCRHTVYFSSQVCSMQGSSVLCSSMRPPWTLRSREKKSSSSMGPGALLRWSSSLPWACGWEKGGKMNSWNVLCSDCALVSQQQHLNTSLLTCVVRIILYRSSLGTGTGAGAGTDAGADAGLLRESCFKLPLKLLALDFGKGDVSSWALWSSSRRAWAVATSSKNSSFCSEVMEEKVTVEKTEKRELWWSDGRSRRVCVNLCCFSLFDMTQHCYMEKQATATVLFTST